MYIYIFVYYFKFDIKIMSSHNVSSIGLFGEKLGMNWPSIEKAENKAKEIQSTIRNALEEPTKLFNSSDISLVVFGSVARLECTEKSDVDWTLLIDGEANPQHQKIASRIKKKLEEKGLTEPTPGGVFGSLVFSHDLIHHIGGYLDTNSNITQRILLLLESSAIHLRDSNNTVGITGDEAYECRGPRYSPPEGQTYSPPLKVV